MRCARCRLREKRGNAYDASRHPCSRCRGEEERMLLLPRQLRRPRLRERWRSHQDRRRSRLHQPGWSVLPRHERAQARAPSGAHQPLPEARRRKGREQVGADPLGSGHPRSRREAQPDQGRERRRGGRHRRRHDAHRRLRASSLLQHLRFAEQLPQRAAVLDSHLHGRDGRGRLVAVRDRPGRFALRHPVGHEPRRIHAARHARLHRPAAQRPEDHRGRPALFRDRQERRPVAAAASGFRHGARAGHGPHHLL